MGLNCPDDRLRDPARLDLRAVQDSDAVSRYTVVETDEAARLRIELGGVRRLHADVPPPESHHQRIEVPARRGICTLLRAADVSREPPRHSQLPHPTGA